MNSENFTQEDLEDWKSYEEIRSSGEYNMFDPRAHHATGLSGERYSFVMENFSKLKKAFEAQSSGKNP